MLCRNVSGVIMTKIEVICGFLESGKTTLIQHILEQDYIEQYRRILILQCEEGMTEFRASTMKNKNVVLTQIEGPYKIRAKLFAKIRDELEPDLILVEYNGTWPIEKLLCVNLPVDYKIDKILFCSDASTFELYMKNTGILMLNQLNNVDAVFFNRCDGNFNTLKADVKNNNRQAELLFSDKSADQYLATFLKPEEIQKENHIHNRNRVGAVISLVCIYLIILAIPLYYNAFSFIKSANMIFIGILMQAVPFLLIGAFVSAFLQVFVPDETLVRIFTRHKWLGFPLALILGFFFPVCDCGIVPIASRLTQKGVPLPQAMVFMLAAPAMNPVTILSTLYAFPGQPQYALCRIGLGALVALLAGFVLSVMHTKSENVLTAFSTATCSCASVTSGIQNSGMKGKIESVFLIAGQEFFNMGRFIVIGSLACSILQQSIPVSFFGGTGAKVVLPIAIMLLAAFFMSVCSTSNAFIGRSFLNVFPTTAVMGFIVMGPMLDLTNLFMMSSSFKKKFIMRLIVILIAIAFPVFLLFSALLKGGTL